MKRFPKYLLIMLITFFIGLIAVSAWFLSKEISPQPTETATINLAENSIAEVKPETVETEDEFRTPLDEIWLEDEEFSYQGFTIEKKVPSNCLELYAASSCSEVTVKKEGKILVKTGARESDWVRYGFYNFLNEDDKQLIVHTYSGGAHCCYNYIIFDLKPTFRVVYDSRKFDSANEIGNDLIPVDIDGNGIFEFQQDVMAFDYMSPGGHATSTFPPAIFSYNEQTKRYEFANKQFPNYVIDELNKNLAGHDKWVKGNVKYGTIITQEELDEISVREKTLYLIYAGKEKEGWKLFDENYNFQFREKFRKEIKESLSKDPTYLSIYK